MVALKKTDKIIVLIGVIIVIVAAVGIILYTAPEKEDVNGDEVKEMDFNVMWTKYSGMKSEAGYAGKKEPYSDSLRVSAPSGSVLTRVEVTISWEDDVWYRGILGKGLDTLYADVGLGGKTESEESTGSGNMTFMFTINSIPSDMTMTSTSEYDAEEELQLMYDDKNDATFNVDVSVDTGERIWRFLKFIRDKGNSFDIEFEYEYYQAGLEKIVNEDNNDNGDTNLESSNPWQATTYKSLLLSGRV